MLRLKAHDRLRFYESLIVQHKSAPPGSGKACFQEMESSGSHKNRRYCSTPASCRKMQRKRVGKKNAEPLMDRSPVLIRTVTCFPPNRFNRSLPLRTVFPHRNDCATLYPLSAIACPLSLPNRFNRSLPLSTVFA